MSLIDLSFLKSFSGDNAEKMNKYINLFLQHAPVLVTAMEKSLSEKNYDALKTSAHSLKPQITYMGIKSAEDLVKGIEFNAGQRLHIENIPAQIEQLKDILSKAYPELKGAVTA